MKKVLNLMVDGMLVASGMYGGYMLARSKKKKHRTSSNFNNNNNN